LVASYGYADMDTSVIY